jgi:hypothetical protein
MHIITDHVMYGFLVSSNGFIPFMLSPNMTFLRSLEKSSCGKDQNVPTVYHPCGVKSFHPSCDSHAKSTVQHPLGLIAYASSSQSHAGTTSQEWKLFFL